MVNFSNHENEQKPILPSIQRSSKSIRKSPKPFQSLNKTSYNLNISSINNFIPFGNFPLFPSILQDFIQSSPEIKQFELSHVVQQLKTPKNYISYRKKMEKLKLLELSQDTFLQNFLKEKYAKTQNPNVLKEFYQFTKEKLVFQNKMEENSINLNHNEFNEEKKWVKQEYNIKYEEFDNDDDSFKFFSLLFYF